MVYFPQNHGVSVSSVPPFPTIYTTPVLTVVHLLLMFFTTVHSSVQCLMLRSAHTPSVLYRAVSYTAQCLIPRSVFYRALSYAAQCLMSHSVLCPTYLGGAAGLRGVPGEQGQRTVYGQLQQRPKQPKRWPNHQRKVRPFRLFHDS